MQGIEEKVNAFKRLIAEKNAEVLPENIADMPAKQDRRYTLVLVYERAYDSGDCADLGLVLAESGAKAIKEDKKIHVLESPVLYFCGIQSFSDSSLSVLAPIALERSVVFPNYDRRHFCIFPNDVRGAKVLTASFDEPHSWVDVDNKTVKSVTGLLRNKNDEDSAAVASQFFSVLEPYISELSGRGFSYVCNRSQVPSNLRDYLFVDFMLRAVRLKDDRRKYVL